MGLWREVYVSASGPVAVRYPAVVSHVDAGNAQLLVTAQLKNGTQQRVKGTLKGAIEKVEFSQDVELAPGESKDVVFDSAAFPALNFHQPRLWWPARPNPIISSATARSTTAKRGSLPSGLANIWRGLLKNAISRSQPHTVDNMGRRTSC